MSRWLQGLNPEQGEAVLHNTGPMLILAGAGSGKTTVLVARAGRLIEEKVIKANELTVLTFTNKAARELKHRVEHRLGAQAKGMWAGTFHSFGLQILKKYHKEAKLPARFSVLDQSDSESIVKDLLKDLVVAGKDKFAIDKIKKIIDEKRINPHKTIVAEEEYLEVAEVLAPRYEKRLLLLGAVDFEGLLLSPLKLLTENEHICEEVRKHSVQLMVDEFQDTNSLQMELIDMLLTKPTCNITVVGDDDQSIYGWRGAIIQNILDFPKVYKGAKVVRLERNYRSSGSIVDIANDVISKNQHRHGKILKAETSYHNHLPEVFPCETEDDELEHVVSEVRYFLAQGYKHKDIAILFRSNTQGGMLEGAFRRNNIPYKITGSSTLLERKEVKEVLAYIRSAFLPNDLGLKRILNLPARGLGDVTLEVLVNWAESHKQSFYQALKHANETTLKPQVVEKINEFLEQLVTLKKALIDGSKTPGEELLHFFSENGYRTHVYRSTAEPQGGEKKWMLVEILSRILNTFIEKGSRSADTILEFLEALELRDIETEEDKDKDEVQLLTMHASKGLEFPAVMIIGVEEDIIPHRTLGSDVSEERRLFYVAVTRAKERLSMSYSKLRSRHGRLVPAVPSRFLVEIDTQKMTEFISGFRPVSGEERKQMLSDFKSRLQSRKGSTAQGKIEN